MNTDPEHHPSCRFEEGGAPCRQFSTDGTRLGAEIAHAMETADEDQISRMAKWDDPNRPFVSDVEDEQRDWDAC